MDITHNNTGNGGVFEAMYHGRRVGYLSYVMDGESIIVAEHTVVNPECEGHGIGKKLVNASVEFARCNGLKIRPVCSFVVAAFGRNDSFNDVLYR